MKLRNKKTKEVGLLRNIAFSLLGDVATIQLIIEIDGCNITHYYHTLSEVYAEWEDYTPQEPLIKDEKIRKAVRAWAEVNSIDNVLYAERPDRSLCVLTDMGDDDEYVIELVGWIPTLKDAKTYTITELCGEEE